MSVSRLGTLSRADPLPALARNGGPAFGNNGEADAPRWLKRPFSAVQLCAPAEATGTGGVAGAAATGAGAGDVVGTGDHHEDGKWGDCTDIFGDTDDVK